MHNVVYLLPLAGSMALLYTLLQARWIITQDAGSKKMQEISKNIAQGAMTFLQAAYKKMLSCHGKHPSDINHE